ncbi:hypothetical protein CRM22_006729 [Opisthorchis felineus]|uniref:Uncharacterized protein n=1 Tax=Opisthorchis felineus TaxID=147828 RepID=A0A4S2LJS1_OPIFE|nr:hypothetical protein CRM22_006729 [Opisthorchis felineus]
MTPDRIPDGVDLKTIRATVNVLSTQSVSEPSFVRWSSGFRLLKAIVWLRRFIRYLMHKSGRSIIMPTADHLQVKELTDAQMVVIRQVQAEAYEGEINRLKMDTQSKPARISALRELCPILLGGVLCVGGRLQYSSCALSLKHPPILLGKHPPILLGKHPFTDPLIRHYHEAEGYSGTFQVLGVVRQNAWIVHGSEAVKRALRKCI